MLLLGPVDVGVIAFGTTQCRCYDCWLSVDVIVLGFGQRRHYAVGGATIYIRRFALLRRVWHYPPAPLGYRVRREECDPKSRSPKVCQSYLLLRARMWEFTLSGLWSLSSVLSGNKTRMLEFTLDGLWFLSSALSVTKGQNAGVYP